MSSITDMMFNDNWMPYINEGNLVLSSKILDISIFAFTPEIEYDVDDKEYRVNLRNVITDEVSSIFISRIFDTVEQATIFAHNLKSNGAQGKEIFEEYDPLTIQNYINKIKATKFNIASVNAVITFSDIFEWQNATIDAGLEIYLKSDNYYYARLPNNLFKAIIATMSNYKNSSSQTPVMEENMVGKFLVVSNVENGSKGFIYTEFYVES